jgi:hypothetical protein
MDGLRDAESKFDQGQYAAARTAARSLLTNLESLDFRGAMQALAGTCRTRGELGMLSTVNARYGRYYATILQRLARVIGQPLPESFGWGRWRGEEVLIVYPVPNCVPADQPVNFDAVLLPQDASVAFEIVLTKLAGQGLASSDTSTIKLPLERINGAYYRAVFSPPGQGTWAWRLAPCGEYRRPADALPLAEGVVTIIR